MTKLFVVFLLLIFMLFTRSAFASTDPLSVLNNKFAVHILFPAELEDASKLVNSNGGDWGYVVIPIQSNDKDLGKWQSFMDNCRRLHLIPIIRLSTEGDYFNTKVWEKPSKNDIIDFANFLDSLSWPTQNRYVIIFNEVNRGDEWGGTPNPLEYADLLNFAVTVFKSTDSNFFILPAGLDSAASNSQTSIGSLDFISDMNGQIPGIFNQVDGWTSHAYPNPAFSQSPDLVTPENISSYKFEKDSLSSIASKDFPIFITETGWPRSSVSDQTGGSYMKEALDKVWTEDKIVAIAPFLLKAGAGPFEDFSLIRPDGSKSSTYNVIYNYPKTRGKPILSKTKVLGENTEKNLPTMSFPSDPYKKNRFHVAEILFRFLVHF